MDKLQEMWEQQKKFMELLQERRDFTKFPVDMTSKSGQKLLKGITHECMHELFEANQMLKNSKDHRATDARRPCCGPAGAGRQAARQCIGHAKRGLDAVYRQR